LASQLAPPIASARTRIWSVSFIVDQAARFTGSIASLRRSTPWKTGTLIDLFIDQGASRFAANG
jgi:hypothetical protein